MARITLTLSELERNALVRLSEQQRRDPRAGRPASAARLGKCRRVAGRRRQASGRWTVPAGKEGAK
jgi:hypothetical protein